MPAIFEPPVAYDWTFADGATKPGERRYWTYYGTQPRGRSVLKTAGVWTVVDLPTTAQIRTANTIVDINGQTVPGYLAGGHVHTVTDLVATELVADGFTITDFSELYTYPSSDLYPSAGLYPSGPR